jgi:hypothetical protein
LGSGARRARCWFRRRYVGREFARRVYWDGDVMYNETEIGESVLRFEGKFEAESGFSIDDCDGITLVSLT